MNSPSRQQPAAQLIQTLERGGIEKIRAMDIINTPDEYFADTMRAIGASLPSAQLANLFPRLAPAGSLSERCSRTQLAVELMIGAHTDTSGKPELGQELSRLAEKAFEHFPRYGYGNVVPRPLTDQLSPEAIPGIDERRPSGWASIH